MKLSDPGRFSLIITSVLTALLLILMLAVVWVQHHDFTGNDLLAILMASALFFIAAFLLLRSYTEKYIYRKIKVIYKTIHRLKKSPGDKPGSDDSQNAIEKVNQEVEQWQKDTYQQIEDLKQRARYRREFIGNVSHELKTPIFNIQGYILTLLDGAVDDPSINRQYLSRTERSINRLISIIEDLEDISQLESGSLRLNQEPFNLVQLAREAMDHLEIQEAQKNISIYFRKKYDKPIIVKADRNRIRQVFNNLIENAIKYGKQNGAIKISFFDLYDHILCEVTDDGPGIAEASLPRLFERFYRTDKARSRDRGGSGLGLAIVKHIIEAHGQTINVRSKLKVGTTFAFTLKKG
jgi:two-component system phosphate regulon sensor histidine kinase PhoR